MTRWLDPAWYGYLRDRLGPDRMILIGLAALAALFLGGLFAMQAIGGSSSSANADAAVQTTIVRVPVTTRVDAKPVTLEQTRTIRLQSGTQIVTKPTVRYEVVRVHGKNVTVRQVVTNTRMLTNTVVNERTNTVVQNETETQTQTQTLPPRTVVVTVTGPAKTETVVTTVTVTAPAVTVTLPGATVTTGGH